MCKCIESVLETVCSCFKRTTSEKSIDKKLVKKDKSDKTLETMSDKPVKIDESMTSEYITFDKTRYDDKFELFRAVLKDYDINADDKIGKGSFGEVYKIRHKISGQTFALKVMKLKIENQFNSNRFNQLKNEVSALMKISHKNIIKIEKHLVLREIYCSLPTEGDLQNRLKTVYRTSRLTLTESQSKWYFIEMANALHFLHSMGLSDGDIKLENILITKKNDSKQVIKVTDFGSTRQTVADNWLVKAKQAMATLNYMAPQQLRVYISVNLKRPDLLEKSLFSYNPIKSDVYALGICLYRLLLYKRPFDFSVEQMDQLLDNMKTGFKGPENTVNHLSTDCLGLLYDLLEYNRNRRINMRTVITHKWIYNSPNLDRI